MANQNLIMAPFRIFIVEDDPIFADYIRCILSDMGITSELSLSAEDAIDKLAEDCQYNLVLLDIMLPKMSGIDFASYLREHDKFNNLPIVFLSQLTDHEQIIKSYDIGALDYITKPIHADLFRAKIKSLSQNILKCENIKVESNKFQHLFNKLHHVILSCNDGLLEVNEQLEIIFVNPAASQMLGLAPISYHGQSLKDLICYEELINIDWQEVRLACRNNDQTFSKKLHFWHRSNDGQKRLLSLQLIITEQSKTHFYLQITDITPLGTQSDYFYNPENIDPITGLVNHTCFIKSCENTLKQNQGTDYSLALIVVNIARFSAINDRYGHSVGDRILKRVAVRLKLVLSAFDVISRFGNDEFTILLDNKLRWGVSKQISIIENLFDEPLVFDDDISIRVNINIGIAMFPQCGENFSLLYQSAKIALESAKEDPVKSFYFYNDEIDQISRFYLRIVELFDSALKNDEFSMNYQPQYDLATGKLSGVEALLRWHSPEQGIIPPAVFIPIAEESNYIIPIGNWIIKRVLADIASLGKLFPCDVRIAINLSTKQLRPSNLSNLIELLEQTMLEFGIANEILELEITEHSLLSNTDDTLAQLEKLRAKGFGISLDDFGTGYSSLTYVQKLPIDRLKIDLSFVKMIGKDNKTQEIIKLILELSKSLGLTTIAEGIETREQLEFLTEMGCTIGQGYLLSKPLPLENLAQVLSVIPVAFKK